MLLEDVLSKGKGVLNLEATVVREVGEEVCGIGLGALFAYTRKRTVRENHAGVVGNTGAAMVLRIFGVVKMQDMARQAMAVH